MDRLLSPAETARRFGVSIKALRLYEQRGFLKPLRTSNGSTGAAWRVYGPDQLARLHQILALKRLGLSLTQIGEFLGGGDVLDPILAFQERALARDSERISRALVLLRKARAKLASGEPLSIDDLTTLTQETVMTSHPVAKELKEAMTPFAQKHLTPQDDASLKDWQAAQSDLFDRGRALMEEAAGLMASGDATTPAAMDFARRFRALTAQLNSSPSPVPAMAPRMKAALDEARSDPQASPKMEVFGFIQQALANLQARERDAGDEL
jgi:DNA-binding transcriptional MerR regulator